MYYQGDKNDSHRSGQKGKKSDQVRPALLGRGTPKMGGHLGSEILPESEFGVTHGCSSVGLTLRVLSVGLKTSGSKQSVVRNLDPSCEDVHAHALLRHKSEAAD